MKGEEFQSVHQQQKDEGSNPSPRNKDRKEDRDADHDFRGQYQGQFRGGRGKDCEWTRPRELALEHNAFTPLTEGYSKVFVAYTDEVLKPPPPTKGFIPKKDNNKYCEYHELLGYPTDD